MLVGLVTAPRRLELVEMPEPILAPGTALVHIHRCGICGTDVHGYLGPEPYLPAICGHEFVGTVVALGAELPGAEPSNRVIREGDRVVAGVAPACGRCTDCRSGRPAHCIASFLGMIGRDALAPPHGGFAPRIALDVRRLVAVRPELTDDQAAMVEPTSVALHAVRRTLPRPDELVVVQGCGPIGLLLLQCVRALGAGRIVAVEPDPTRRALARTLGADEALDPAEAVEQIGRRGADLVFECAGVASTVQQAVRLVRRGGRVNLVGLAAGAASIDPGEWLVKEVSVVASLGALHHEFGEVIDLIAGAAVHVGPLHDRTIPLADLPAEMERLAADPGSAVKVLVDVTD